MKHVHCELVIFLWYRPLTHKHQTRLERSAKYKHSSFIRTFVTCVRKTFYNIGPWVQDRLQQIVSKHFFPSSMMLTQSKLECLSLPKLVDKHQKVPHMPLSKIGPSREESYLCLSIQVSIARSQDLMVGFRHVYKNQASSNKFFSEERSSLVANEKMVVTFVPGLSASPSSSPPPRANVIDLFTAVSYDWAE